MTAGLRYPRYPGGDGKDWAAKAILWKKVRTPPQLKLCLGK